MAEEKIAPDLRPLAVDIGTLWEWPINPYQGDDGAISVSYERFTQLKPVVTFMMTTENSKRKKRRVVIAGNTQLRSARSLGWNVLAAVSADHLTKTEAIAFAIADNETAKRATRNDEMFIEIMHTIAEDDHDLFEATSWDDDHLDNLMQRTVADRHQPGLNPEPGPDIEPEGSVHSGRSTPTTHICPHCSMEFQFRAGSGPSK